MRILLAWELGQGYGHLFNLLPIARALRVRGHQVVAAVKDVASANTVLHPDGIPFVPAPAAPRPIPLGRDICSYADILAVHGFADPAALAALTRGWRHVLRQCGPDAVVVNHAPGALLAARLYGIPVAEVGTGFELPPPLSPYPCFRPWLKLPASALAETEMRILACINDLREERGQAPLPRLCDLSGSARLLATFPDIDHYPERQARTGPAHYVGPLAMLGEGQPAAWPARHRKNVFVYLHPDDGIESILAMLRRTAANILCVSPGIPAALRRRHTAPHLAIHADMIALGPLLASCDLAVSHAGHGVLSACLLAGVPVLALPRHVEQWLLAKCLLRTGTGRMLLPSQIGQHFTGTLEDMLGDDALAGRARALAAKHATHDAGAASAQVADFVLELAGGQQQA